MEQFIKSCVCVSTMASYKIKLSDSDFKDNSVSDCYLDVNLYTEKKTIKAHKHILAKRSPWFHRFFQSQENMQWYNVAFFGHAETLVQAAVDVIYEKEILFQAKEKNRLTTLLNRLGVKWCDEPMPEEMLSIASGSKASKPSEKEAEVVDKLECRMTEEVATPHPPLMEPPIQPKSDSSPKRAASIPPIPSKPVKAPAKEASNEDDFFAVLDKFTEKSEEELKKISHMLIGEDGEPSRMYKCLKCPQSCKYFSQAQKHHLEHEFSEYSWVREILKKAELERQNDVQNIAKIEKGIGKTDKKKLVRALKQINENLHKHLENLDALEKSKLPLKLSKKCRDYSRSLIETTRKADKVLNKLGL